MENSGLPKALVLGAGMGFLCAVGGLAAAPSDQAASKIEFEAASVKPSGPQKAGAGIFGKILGGPGRSYSTERLTCHAVESCPKRIRRSLRSDLRSRVAAGRVLRYCGAGSKRLDQR